MIQILVAIHFLLWQFVFSFQRHILRKARRVAPVIAEDVYQCQLTLTPGWIGLFGWINRIFAVIVIVLVFIQYGLVWSGVLAACIYLGLYALVSTPFEKLIESKSNKWIKQALQGYKKTPGGYLIANRIESVMNHDINNDR